MNKIKLYKIKKLLYKLNMKLNDTQMMKIKQACEDVEFGSVTIKLNANAKFIDLVIEKQVRMNSEPTRPPVKVVDKKY